MKNKPILNHPILEKILIQEVLSDEELQEILLLEKSSLVSDLQNIITFCNEDLFDISDEKSTNALVYALFLLKECTNQDHFHLIMDTLNLDDDTIDYWFSDFFTEYFWSLVYHFGIDQIDELVNFLKQEETYTFCKEQVALALYQIYLKNPDKREVISNYWTELLTYYNELPPDSDSIDDTYFAFFVCYIAEPTEHQKILIKGLYDKDHIDEMMNGTYEDLFEIIEEERDLISIFDINEDILEYQKELDKELNNKILADLLKKPQTTKKVGRNDPCSCGSGLKYKKCCL